MCNVPDVFCTALVIAMTLAMSGLFVLIMKVILEDR